MAGYIHVYTHRPTQSLHLLHKGTRTTSHPHNSSIPLLPKTPDPTPTNGFSLQALRTAILTAPLGATPPLSHTLWFAITTPCNIFLAHDMAFGTNAGTGGEEDLGLGNGGNSSKVVTDEQCKSADIYAQGANSIIANPCAFNEEIISLLKSFITKVIKWEIYLHTQSVIILLERDM